MIGGLLRIQAGDPIVMMIRTVSLTLPLRGTIENRRVEVFHGLSLKGREGSSDGAD
jgi:hypothetical protein